MYFSSVEEEGGAGSGFMEVECPTPEKGNLTDMRERKMGDGGGLRYCRDNDNQDLRGTYAA